MARLSEFSPEIGDAICELIADGQSLRAICAPDAMPAKSTVFKWLRDNQSFSDQYARAKEAQAENFADELMEIADDASGDVSGELEMPNGVAVQRSKLRIDTRKWVMSKLLAKKYGDKLQHTGGDGEGPVQFVVTRAGQKEK
jgi:hypothetical protein